MYASVYVCMHVYVVPQWWILLRVYTFMLLELLNVLACVIWSSFLGNGNTLVCHGMTVHGTT